MLDALTETCETPATSAPFGVCAFAAMRRAPATTGPQMTGPQMTGPDDSDDGQGETGVAVKSRAKTKRPSMYKVLLLHDDYTPMEFVVHVLARFFGMGHERSVQIMLAVHNQGVAVVGVFTYEVAETKVTQVMDYARQHQHPLQCAMEKE